MTARRLATGGHIDRSTPLSFSWDGISMKGFTDEEVRDYALQKDED